MSGGLFALLDDAATIAKMAAASVDDVSAAAGKATVKTTGVVVDDTAVTPQYVRGITADRELPVIRRIASGSLRNKMVVILPVALVLSQFVPFLLVPLLMAGGAYLCFEGAEKVWAALVHHRSTEGHLGHADHTDQVLTDEGDVVREAVRTDLILSTEIMVIALNEVAQENFISRVLVLAVVAVAMTFVVYGAVGLLVKMDDAGLYLAEHSDGVGRRLGLGLVAAMPHVLRAITVIGVVAMLWVGGHLELAGLDEIGFGSLYDAVHHLAHVSDQHAPLGALVAWVVTTSVSAAFGLVVGAGLVATAHVLPHKEK